MITSFALGLGAEFMVLGRFFPCLGVVSAVLRARGGVETLRELCLYEFMVAGFRLALEGETAFRERAFLSGVLQELDLDF
jgi:hypothetical protein